MKKLPVIIGNSEIYAAQKAANFIAERAAEAIQARGVFLIAFSGGKTPLKMFEMLGRQSIDWSKVHVFQVDERLAPDGPDQNYFQLHEALLSRVPLPPDQVHHVNQAVDAESAAALYASAIHDFLGVKPTLDLVHLGLGSDGHTASLVPNDEVLKCAEDIGVSQVYGGWRRVTMTYPMLNRARGRLWLVTGQDKAAMLEHLLAHSGEIPAVGISRQNTVVFADDEAATGGGE